MKKLLTALTCASLIASPVMAGGSGYDLDKGMGYSKSTQSGPTSGPVGSGGAGSFAETWPLWLLAAAIVIAIASNSDDSPIMYSTSN